MSKRLGDPKLIDATARAEAAREAETLLLASLSHDLRTPLHVIIGTASLLDHEALPPAAAESIRTITVASRSLLDLADGFLRLAQSKSGNRDRSAVPFDLVEILRDVETQVFAEAAAKGVRIALHIAAHTPTRLVGDRASLSRLLLNLAWNAVKFTDQGAVLIAASSAVSRSGRLSLRFEVVDTGTGIAPEAQEGIFEPFRQGNHGVRAGHGGAGLGLAICKQLVADLGGEIGVTSSAGTGSTFWFDVEVDALDPRTGDATDTPPAVVLTMASASAAQPQGLPGIEMVTLHAAARTREIETLLRDQATAGHTVIVPATVSEDVNARISEALEASAGAQAPPVVLVGHGPGWPAPAEGRWIAQTALPAASSADELGSAIRLAHGLRRRGQPGPSKSSRGDCRLQATAETGGRASGAPLH